MSTRVSENPSAQSEIIDPVTPPAADAEVARPGFRLERDSLGPLEVPENAYWGVHTKRAMDNFPIAKRPISVYPDFIVALASVKQACARANKEIGALSPEKAGWIDAACQDIIDGEYHDEFVVGVIQAATSVNEQTLTFVPKLAITALVLVVALRYPLNTALTVAASLAQIGEFSFILAGLGLSVMRMRESTSSTTV